jgi:hypothetical protein
MKKLKQLINYESYCWTGFTESILANGGGGFIGLTAYLII